MLIAMEATGHYWYGLHDFLARNGYRVVVLNPIQTAMQAKKGIRKCKTDRIDRVPYRHAAQKWGIQGGIGAGRIRHDLSATYATALPYGGTGG